MSPAIRELTPADEVPPIRTTSDSIPYFLKRPFSSAIQRLALMGVNELKPTRRRSASDAALMLMRKPMHAAVARTPASDETLLNIESPIWRFVFVVRSGL